MAYARFLAALLAPAALAAPAGAGALNVLVDHATPLRLAEEPAAVSIGNPLIADVTAVDAKTFLVIGKTFGTTNLIALDRNGQTIYSTTLRVRDDTDGAVVLHRGSRRVSMDCHPACHPAPKVGDDMEAFNAAMDARVKAIQSARGDAASE